MSLAHNKELREWNAAQLSPDQRNLLPNIETAALQTIANMWQRSTWETKQQLWRRLETFVAERRLDPRAVDYNIMLFVQSCWRTTTPATRAKYVTVLTSTAARFGLETPASRLYRRGLAANGALLPTEQARPITVPELAQLLRAIRGTTAPIDTSPTESDLDEDDTAMLDILAPGLERRAPAVPLADLLLVDELETAIFIMWKTCSRYDDVARMTKRQFIRTSEREIIISWADNTKTTRTDPFRQDSQVAVRMLNDAPIPRVVLETIAEMPANRPLLPRNSGWFRRFLARAVPPPPNQRALTAHSFKRGALQYLAQQVAEGRLPISLLPVMAKHKTGLSILPETTLRYIADVALKAHVMETHRATALLPWP